MVSPSSTQLLSRLHRSRWIGGRCASAMRLHGTPTAPVALLWPPRLHVRWHTAPATTIGPTILIASKANSYGSPFGSRQVEAGSAESAVSALSHPMPVRPRPHPQTIRAASGPTHRQKASISL